MSKSIARPPRTTRIALLALALFGAPIVEPSGIARAAPPNEITNQTIAPPTPQHRQLDASTMRGGTGPYDYFDQFRDQKGFPLPGQAQLFFTQ